ncbi:MAG TPA: nucleotidyltransferase domain-containing protein [Phnomibacter sp.]|nr:nucleotidyltransferase domain-containing protein [Phnomibacter sp.]
MNDLQLKKNEIIDLCKASGIKSLYAFGSAVRNELSDESDYDFLYEFRNKETDPIKEFEKYLEIKGRMQDVLGRNVDLIQYDQLTNPYLKHFINKEKVIIYAEA